MHKLLLDTSFFIRLLNPHDKLHKNAKEYFKHFLEKEIEMYCSTISIAEYCVRGNVDELPLREIRILPFNFFHAVTAGKFAETAYKNKESMKLPNRAIILNDIKLFAQASYENEISHFITSDKDCLTMFNAIKKKALTNFDVINISEPLSQTLGELPFDKE
ncbi:MAG: PIN domain-containing protein [Bacteroidetes bacterium]|nr:PIN domain-containing protein [Bacteroidota bacterium]